MAKNQITALADKLNAEFYSVSETGRQIALKVTEVKMQLREMRIGIMNDNIRRLSHSNSIE